MANESSSGTDLGHAETDDAHALAQEWRRTSEAL